MKTIKKYIAMATIASLVMCSFFGCGKNNDEGSADEPAATEDASDPADSTKEPELSPEEQYELDLAKRIDEKLSSMTLDEKLCQMFVLTPESLTGADTVTAAGDSTRIHYDERPVGGVVYFAKNLNDPEQTSQMLSNMTDIATDRIGLVPFLCIDEEGGRVLRIGNNDAFGVTTVGPMADVSSEDEAKDDGAVIGEYLRDLGFNVDFAPCADVLTNPANEVIGNRSFGSDGDRVASYAAAYSDGLHESGVMSAYKHFPGHGATAADSHTGSAYVDKSLDELMDSELKPFISADSDGADFVMVGHISCPGITGDDTPATLSETMVTDILRQKLGYNGLIITDSLSMGAVSDIYSSSDAAVKAVSAGVDVLLMPKDFEGALSGLKQAVSDGTISEERIDQSVRRIIEKKLRWADKNMSHSGLSADESMDYSDTDNWAYYAMGDDKKVDVFMLAPTADQGENFQADAQDDFFREVLKNSLNMQKGIFEDNARLFAPYYNQASMRVYELSPGEREPYMERAYQDVSDAFSYYLKHENNGRPIVLYGFSQGADMTYRLLEEYFDDEELKGQLVAAYAIGWPCTKEMVSKYPWIEPATGEDDLGVVITYEAEAPEVTGSFIVPEDTWSYSINPLNWKTDGTVADKSLNEGACFADYNGTITKELEQWCGAYIDDKRGTLKVTDIDPANWDVGLALLPYGSYHIYDYQLFFRNLQENVLLRIEKYYEQNAYAEAA